jgi:hypothetical protein
MDIKLYEVPHLKKVNETMTSIKSDIQQASKLLKQTNISIIDLLNTRIGEVKIFKFFNYFFIYKL